MKKSLLLFSVILFSLAAHSQTPDWTNNISCILYSHCTSCHNPTGLAPFPLLTYTDAASNASEILTQVQNKTMPPFLADISYQQYAHQKTLTQDEINQITDWVNNGTPSGDTTLAPTPPTYTGGAVLINPDFSEAIAPYTLPNLTTDMYRCFVISNPFPTDKYITAMEVIPGNRAAVHHVLVYSDDSNTPVQLDSADSDPGYVSFGGIGSASAQVVGGFVPGSEPYFLPPNMGILVTAGSRIIIQVHYPETASGMTDSTRVNFKFSTGVVRQATTVAALDHSISIVDGPLFIPANTVKTFHEEYTVPVDVTVLSVLPHAHLVCTSMTSYAVTPLNDTIRFETIPHWDFHWQGAYYFQKPLKVPAGSVLYGEATYDNTLNNPNNPNDPPQDVALGESTTDEMMLFYFVYLFYQAGDENIVIDTTGHLPHYLNCVSTLSSVTENNSNDDVMKVYPNPSSQFFCIQFADAGAFTVSITDVAGRTVWEQKNISGRKEIDARPFSSGVYFIHATNESGKEINKKLLIGKQ